MSDLFLAHVWVGCLAIGLMGSGAFLLTGSAAAIIEKLPRAKILGALLSTLCWAWIAAELTLHPIDMIPFSSTTILILCTLCVPLSYILLSNLLCARAIGGLMMLWPMPVILLVRDFITLWRLVPIIIGYISLTLGMFIVFYPWWLRVFCETLAAHKKLRQSIAGLFLLLGFLSAMSACFFGKVVGE